MSYDIFVTAFNQGTPAPFSPSAIRKVFGAFVTDVDPTYWRLRYDEANSCEVMLHDHTGSPESISGFSINRPCADPRLWDALAEILRLGPLTLYSDFPPLVADMSVAQHLPPEMIDGLGFPICVHSGDDILDVLQNT